MPLQYPLSPFAPQTDDYHGTTVSDPYRWLEDPNSPQTKAWVEAQNRLTFNYLEQIPSRQRLSQRLTELWDYPKQMGWFKKGGRYFSFRNSGLQNQSVLYVQDSLDSEARVLLDPNTLSEDGTAALNNYSLSRDGRYLAYAISQGGSDWQTWKVRDVETGQDLPDQIEWSKFSGAAWLPNASGFFYGRYDAPGVGESLTGTNYFPKIYLHRLNTPQAEDTLVYHRPDQKEWAFYPSVTHDGNYLCLSVTKGTHPENLFFYQELGSNYLELDSNGPFVELISEFEAEFAFVGNQGSRFFFKTDLNAPKGKVIEVDIDNPARENWKTIIAESQDTLEGCFRAHDRLVAYYLHHAHHQVRFFGLDGSQVGGLELPTLGSLSELSGEEDDPELFYGFTSFLYPACVYRYDFRSSKSEPLFVPALNFDFQNYQSQQVFVSSKDGTKVPMFIVHKKGLELNGQNPTLLYGYGGFNIPLTPAFSPAWLVWLEQGGIYAQACLRGGGEYGEEWHKAGSLHNKQNVFDDFIACGEWLIAEGWTSAKQLAIQGGSNGGLLVGACMTQRPELFGAALPAVGVMDMLRFHRFTIGWGWVSDYGSPDNPEEFKTLLTYSPLHNLKKGTHYPATLVTTGDHDDRVVPAHSFKFAAALQAAQAGPAPVLIRIQTKAGHGMGKPTRLIIEEQADIYAFLNQVLG